MAANAEAQFSLFSPEASLCKCNKKYDVPERRGRWKCSRQYYCEIFDGLKELSNKHCFTCWKYSNKHHPRVHVCRSTHKLCRMNKQKLQFLLWCNSVSSFLQNRDRSAQGQSAASENHISVAPQEHRDGGQNKHNIRADCFKSVSKKKQSGGDAHNGEGDSAEQYSTSRTIMDMWTNPVQWPIRNNSGIRHIHIKTHKNINI